MDDLNVCVAQLRELLKRYNSDEFTRAFAQAEIFLLSPNPNLDSAYNLLLSLFGRLPSESYVFKSMRALLLRLRRTSVVPNEDAPPPFPTESLSFKECEETQTATLNDVEASSRNARTVELVEQGSQTTEELSYTKTLFLTNQLEDCLSRVDQSHNSLSPPELPPKSSTYPDMSTIVKPYRSMILDESKYSSVQESDTISMFPNESDEQQHKQDMKQLESLINGAQQSISELSLFSTNNQPLFDHFQSPNSEFFSQIANFNRISEQTGLNLMYMKYCLQNQEKIVFLSVATVVVRARTEEGQRDVEESRHRESGKVLLPGKAISVFTGAHIIIPANVVPLLHSIESQTSTKKEATQKCTLIQERRGSKSTRTGKLVKKTSPTVENTASVQTSKASGLDLFHSGSMYDPSPEEALPLKSYTYPDVNGALKSYELLTLKLLKEQQDKLQNSPKSSPQDYAKQPDNGIFSHSCAISLYLSAFFHELTLLLIQMNQKYASFTNSLGLLYAILENAGKIATENYDCTSRTRRCARERRRNIDLLRK